MATSSQALLDAPEHWPALPLEAWEDTCITLQMWLQIVGKLRLSLSPAQNHWWHVPFYVSSRGLTTSPIPHAGRTFEVEFDFCHHNVRICASDGMEKFLPLYSRTVADFYRELMGALSAIGVEARIWPVPVECPNPIPFPKDTQHATYDPEYAHRFWRVLTSADSLFKEFRTPFLGKCSPVHFFWGGMDLAVSRFSGKRAPPREGADLITREGYSHEVISGGFWPGDARFPAPAFYAYSSPEPSGFRAAKIQPPQAFYSGEFGEFLLRYDDVRASSSPRKAVLDFLRSTYEAGATLGGWDRDSLERTPSSAPE
jgi:hypothetical protein